MGYCDVISRVGCIPTCNLKDNSLGVVFVAGDFSQCVCVCARTRVCPSVHPYMPSVLCFSQKLWQLEHEMWTCYKVGGLDLKIRFLSGESQGS